MKVDLVILNIGQLVTCASNGKPKRGDSMLDLGLIVDGAVAIAGGKFAWVGTSEEALREFTSEEIMDAAGRVAVPGFVDPHTHIVFAGDRLNEFELKIKGAEYLEILANGGGIISTVRSTREASVEELVQGGLKRLDAMLACGTTTCEIKTGYGLDTETELKMLEAIETLDRLHVVEIVPTFLAAHAIPPEFSDKSEAYVKLICEEMLPRAWNWYERSSFKDRVPFFVDIFCEQNAFDVRQSERVLRTGLGLGFALKAHVDEFTNMGGSKLAIGLGARSIDHLDAISDKEIQLLASSPTIGVVTPTVNFNFGSSKFANARKLIDEGCSIALSTDYNPGSAPCSSQPMAMAIACRYQKLLPAEAMNAATINAAHAIGAGDRVGSIEVGKSADIMMVDMRDYRELAYEFGRVPVKTVLKRGEVVLEAK